MALNPAGQAATDAETVISLERIAELERSGSYFPGLGLVESALREKAGDYTGAALAAYKELSWAFSLGSAVKEQVDEGLQNAIRLSGSLPANAANGSGSACDTLAGCQAFSEGNWELAENLLVQAIGAEEEPDSFLRWMLMVCAMEKGDNDPILRQTYSAIRARYILFPEYWYRGARAFSQRNENISASYAELCINISPKGPFAEDCRKILAGHIGLAPDGRSTQSSAHSDIRTRAEIENTIRSSVSVNNPAILEELYPLMTLPENPYTLYAMGALKSLAAVPDFRNFFVEGAAKSTGRLGERLSYIARG